MSSDPRTVGASPPSIMPGPLPSAPVGQECRDLPDYICVAVSRAMVEELATKESEPVVLIGLEPIGPADEDGFQVWNMLLRRPSRAELAATIRERFTSSYSTKGPRCHEH